MREVAKDRPPACELRTRGGGWDAMSAVAIGFGVAALVFDGGVAGMYLHRFLPPEHLSKESRDVVMLGTGMLSVLASQGRARVGAHRADVHLGIACALNDLALAKGRGRRRCCCSASAVLGSRAIGRPYSIP
jgi:hypothetical protein